MYLMKLFIYLFILELDISSSIDLIYLIHLFFRWGLQSGNGSVHISGTASGGSPPQLVHVQN